MYCRGFIVEKADSLTPYSRMFGCVNPEEISFCAEHQIVAEAGSECRRAPGDGVALTGNRYDQIYLHIFKIRGGQIVALIEGFDTALANHALWGDCEPLIPDEGGGTFQHGSFHGCVMRCLPV